MALIFFEPSVEIFRHARFDVGWRFQTRQTLLLNAEAAYQNNKTWRISAEILNLLDRRDHDIDYAYTSRVTPASNPQFQNVFHPVEPIQVRFALTAHF